MRPRALPTLATFVTAATLTLTACGSSGDTSAGDDIPGADDGKSSASPSPSDSAKKNDGKRPEIKLPSDVKYKFQWDSTGNKAKDAVLSDTKKFIKAVDMAIVQQNAMHEAYLFYTEGEAAYDSQTWVQSFIDAKDTTTGTRRFYDAKVKVTGNGQASLTYCEDQTQAFSKDLETGKVKKTEPSDNSYIIYASELKKNDKGVWVTYTLESHKGARPCLP